MDLLLTYSEILSFRDMILFIFTNMTFCGNFSLQLANEVKINILSTE